MLVGEWGGHWFTTTWNGQVFSSTATWQQALADYLVVQGVGSFYWTLNDNSFRTGSCAQSPHKSPQRSPQRPPHISAYLSISQHISAYLTHLRTSPHIFSFLTSCSLVADARYEQCTATIPARRQQSFACSAACHQRSCRASRVRGARGRPTRPSHRPCQMPLHRCSRHLCSRRLCSRHCL